MYGMIWQNAEQWYHSNQKKTNGATGQQGHLGACDGRDGRGSGSDAVAWLPMMLGSAGGSLSRTVLGRQCLSRRDKRNDSKRATEREREREKEKQRKL